MKKLLALLLAALLLVGFGVCAGAEQTQEELEAEGRTLLMDTMEMLRGDYTLWDNYIVHSNGNYALTWNDGLRDLFLMEGIYRVYLDRNAYQKLESSEFNWILALLEPKAVAEDTPISVEKTWDGLRVDFDGLCYYYKAGSLILIWIAGDGRSEQNMSGFRKGADQSVFSLGGMQEVTERDVWLWDASLWEILVDRFPMLVIVPWIEFSLRTIFRIASNILLIPFMILLLPITLPLAIPFTAFMMFLWLIGFIP